MKQAQRPHTLHGILFMALFSFAAFYIADIPVLRDTLRLSPLIIGIVLGLLYANTLRAHLPEEWVPGIKFCSKTLLRLAIIFYGFRLTLSEVFAVGWSAILIDICIVTTIILLGLLVGKLLKIDRDTTLLTSAGSAICGAAAVLGTEPVLKADAGKTVVAVSTVVIFGTIAMFVYPALYSLGIFDLDPQTMGIYTGSTLHEVAHVAGAGETMSVAAGVPEIAGIATITKMIRVILLAPFLLILGAFLTQEDRASSGRKRISIPWFAVLFLVVICINTLIQYLLSGSADATALYAKGVDFINLMDTFALTMAMTALGTEASFAKFREAGAKPFILALILFIWLMGFGYFLARVIPPLFA